MAEPDPSLLTAAVRGALGAPAAAVGPARRLSGGASRETWAVDATVDGDVHELVLQRLRPGAAGAPTGAGGMVAEADLLRLAATAGVPVAPVLAAGDDEPGTGLGGPWLLMRRVPGETIPRRLLRDDTWSAAREVLVDQAAAALAALHAVEVGEAPQGLRAGDQVAQFRGLHDALAQPVPAFELAFRWLEANRPPEHDPVVVHGDFRLGNLVVAPDGLAAVLDWELAHLGDGAEDLGWFCVRSWRFGGPGEAGGLASRRALLDAYAAAGGRAVDEATLLWWEVLGTLKWGVMCIVQARSHLAGLSRSVELAAIGRRVAEVSWDLLDLLTGPASPPPAVAAPDASVARPPHPPPGAAGLVEAVREFLERDVAAATEGRVHFHARVAANVLAMVERELVAGDAQAAAHTERLAALGVADDAELCRAIADGRLDAPDGAPRPDVVEAVRAAVADQLAVANPRWAAATGDAATG